MAKIDKPLTRDMLTSMQVIDAKGRLIGKVKDIAFEVGKFGVSLAVENENGEIQNIEWEDVQGATDFIVLKPQIQSTDQTQSTKKEDWDEVFKEQQTQQTTPKKQSTQPLCPTCNRALTWIPQYKRWYCYNDKKYV